MKRYPGLRNFDETSKDIFFGRDSESIQLFELVERKQISLILGKSGVGKSSLIKAGLKPLIYKTENYNIKDIRFYNHSDNIADDLNLLNIFYQNLDFINDESNIDIWEAFKKYELKENKTILIIFDQFEEIFTYPQNQIKSFSKVINELLSLDPPTRFIKNLEKTNSNITKEGIKIEDFLTKIKIKFLISIRSDKISELYKLNKYIPNINHNEFTVNPLNKENAIQALLKPASLDKYFNKITFESNKFEISEDLLELIFLEFENISNTDDLVEVNPIHLQIIASEIESKVINENLTIIDTTHINSSNLNESVSSFYHRQIDEIKGDSKLFEEVFENLFIQDKNRAIVDRNRLLTSINKEGISKITKSGLIKSDWTSEGTEYFELIHDVLVEPIFEGKSIKIKKIQEIEAAKKKLIDSKKEEQRLISIIEEERRKNLTTKRVFFSFIIATILAIILYNNNQQKNKINSLSEIQITEYNVGLNSFNSGKFEISKTFFTKISNNSKLLNKFSLNENEMKSMIEICDSCLVAKRYFLEGKLKKADDIYKKEFKKITPQLIESFPTFKMFYFRRYNEKEQILRVFKNFHSSENFFSISKSNQNLTTIPDFILDYSNSIRSIYVDGNLFTEIPLAPLRLPKLKVYSLNNNKIETIDSIISQNKTIQSLSLNNNNLEYIPKYIFMMDSLRTVNLKTNNISYIEEFEFRKGSKLHTIVLNNNPLGIFPEILLKNLPNLTEIHLEQTYLDELPDPHVFENTNLVLVKLNGNLFKERNFNFNLYTNCIKNKSGKIIKFIF
jgi:hypothetical protein